MVKPLVDNDPVTLTSDISLSPIIPSAKNIQILHCPTADMLADFFTKPLQGSLFRKFRAVLLGEAHISTLCFDTPTTPSEERVGQKNDPITASAAPTAVPTYLRTTPDASSTIVNVNTSHSIEKYPEVNTI